MSNSPHEALGITPTDAARMGQAFGEEHDAYNEVGMADPQRVIKALGGVAGRSQNPYEQDALRIYAANDFAIVRAGLLASDKCDNEFYARMLGHYHLHYEIPRKRSASEIPAQAIFRNDEAAALRTETYGFMLGLMMPLWPLQQQLRADSSEYAISERFQVSETAVRHRLNHLGHLGVIAAK